MLQFKRNEREINREREREREHEIIRGLCGQIPEFQYIFTESKSALQTDCQFAVSHPIEYLYLSAKYASIDRAVHIFN